MKNVLLRSIGVGADVKVTVTPIELKSGDRFLLCSDGLWGEVGDRAIAEVLARESPASAVGELVDLANAHGGSDNVTVQVAALLESEEESSIAIGTDGPSGAPSPSSFNVRAETPSSGTQTFLPDERRRWTRAGVIAASLLAATVLFWRICA